MTEQLPDTMTDYELLVAAVRHRRFHEETPGPDETKRILDAVHTLIRHELDDIEDKLSAAADVGADVDDIDPHVQSVPLFLAMKTLGKINHPITGKVEDFA